MAQPECPSTSTKYGYQQLHNVDNALAQLERVGFGPGTEAYDTLWRQRGETVARIGYKYPRGSVTISHEEVLRRLETLGLEYAARSPGFSKEELKDAVVRVYLDVEGGWMAEARFKPKGKPIYHSLTTDEAMAFIKGEESGELIAKVFEEDEYLGE